MRQLDGNYSITLRWTQLCFSSLSRRKTRHKVRDHIRSFCDSILSLITHPVKAVLLSRVELVNFEPFLSTVQSGFVKLETAFFYQKRLGPDAG